MFERHQGNVTLAMNLTKFGDFSKNKDELFLWTEIDVVIDD
jgi:hypothetical protein